MALKDIRPALRTFVLADAAVAALASTRMYPVKLPQGQTSPSIVYNEISGDTGLHNEGSDGLSQVRMQIAAWAQSGDQAHALFLAIKARLHGYKGVMGSGATEVTVQLARIDSWRDIDDTAAGLRGKIADYFIWYRDS